MARDSEHAFYDIVDVCEIPAHFSMVEHVDRLALADGLGEEVQGHVRASPWAVNRENRSPVVGSLYRYEYV